MRRDERLVACCIAYESAALTEACPRIAGENPRYAPQMEGAPKLTQETVPILQCIKNMLNDSVPRMRKGDQDEFRQVLKGDKEAQAVIAEYSEKVGAWIKTLEEKARSTHRSVDANARPLSIA